MKNIERKVHKLDAEGQSLGRLSTQIANLLRGKLKPEFQAHLDLGDVVEVENIKKVKLSRKEIKLPEVPYYGIVAPHIGYISLSSFTNITSKEIHIHHNFHPHNLNLLLLDHQ